MTFYQDGSVCSCGQKLGGGKVLGSENFVAYLTRHSPDKHTSMRDLHSFCSIKCVLNIADIFRKDSHKIFCTCGNGIKPDDKFMAVYKNELNITFMQEFCVKCKSNGIPQHEQRWEYRCYNCCGKSSDQVKVNFNKYGLLSFFVCSLCSKIPINIPNQ